MPSKKIHVKPYRVKGHYRTIHTRTFKFICAHCDEESTRVTYATICPKYCDRCKNLKNRLGKKQKGSGQVVSVNSQNQTKNNNIVPIAVEPNSNHNQVLPVENISELDPQKVVKYISVLFLDTYNSQLDSNLKNILVDLWHNRTDEEISKARKLKIRQVQPITSKLIEQLSQALHENINRDNFYEIILKHCLAFESLQTIA